MKRRFILLALVLSVVAVIPAKSSITTEQTTDPEFIINQGYSQITAEDVFVSKNRATGKPIEPLYDKNHDNVLVKTWRTFWGYIDPAHEQVDRIHHDISPSPSYSDL